MQASPVRQSLQLIARIISPSSSMQVRPPVAERRQRQPPGHGRLLEHSGGAAWANPGREASKPPTRAAPINLSALPRESVPLASPLASSSKVRLVVCWLTCLPLSQKGGTCQPRQLANATTLARADEFSMNSWPTSENSSSKELGE